MATERTSMASKLAEITGAMERVAKTGRHPQGWAFATEGDISDAVRPLLAERGIAIIPSLVEHTWSPVGDPNKGGTRHMVKVLYTLTDGHEEVKIEWAGEADDWSDKGLNKAMTACRKYFLINLFMIATGDEEADSSDGVGGAPARAPQQQSYQGGGGYGGNGGGGSGPRNPSAPASDKQIGLIRARARAAGLPEDQLDAVVYAETGGQMSHLKMGDVDNVLKAIQHFQNTGEVPAAPAATPTSQMNAAFDVIKLAQERYEALVKAGGADGVDKARVNEILRAEGVTDMKSLVNDANPQDMTIFDRCMAAIQAEGVTF